MSSRICLIYSLGWTCNAFILNRPGSVGFLGNPDSTTQSKVIGTKNSVAQSVAMGDQLWALKGMVSHTSTGSVLDNPNILNFSLLVGSVLLCLLTFIGGVVGLIYCIHRASQRSDMYDQRRILRMFEDSDAVISNHPGCVRVVQPLDKAPGELSFRTIPSRGM